MRENGRDLERPDEPKLRHCGGSKRRDVASLVEDASPARAHELGQKVKARRFARTVGSDQCVNRAARNLQVDAVDGNEACKFLREVLSLKDEIIAHGECPCWSAIVLARSERSQQKWFPFRPQNLALSILTQQDEVDAGRMHGRPLRPKPAAAAR